ncbi:hypothetical protein GUJ93_ZPchr0013g35208 [Zizania palustris]|uniref:Complex III subunit VII n=1 Tax=Zizania palustris TaxID=103762 RepID=A0A8J6C114_ZIZPA|nr:hypothetical protein GUJ93_ZPchr0013g35208 [Zizania palustris]
MSSMLSALSQWFVNPRRNPLARLHMQAISSRLRKYGLRYDDLYDPKFDMDIKEALERLPREVVDARHQRIKRAMDLSMKHQYPRRRSPGAADTIQKLFERHVGSGEEGEIRARRTGSPSPPPEDPSLKSFLDRRHCFFPTTMHQIKFSE